MALVRAVVRRKLLGKRLRRELVLRSTVTVASSIRRESIGMSGRHSRQSAISAI